MECEGISLEAEESLSFLLLEKLLCFMATWHSSRDEPTLWLSSLLDNFLPLMKNPSHLHRIRFLRIAAVSAFGMLMVMAPAGPDRQDGQPAATVAGEMKRWHPIKLTFDGPQAGESDAGNPFTDYRLNVIFRHEARGDTYVVPGYFAADGDAAETGVSSGTKWRVHFTPALTGAWTYRASFRAGPNVALSLDPQAGSAAAFDGAAGRFSVAETDKQGRDFRGKGMLRYVGERHLRFDNGEWFVKAGADSPETLLAYEDFDGTSVHGGNQSLKSFSAHRDDWHSGDPVWRGNKGKGLIGALNYLASEGLNAFSFLTMNVDGDGKNVWPWIAYDVRDRYDVSKLAQWEEVFTHADSLGLYLHFKTQETENDRLLDGGELGPERKLYYRELVARFGHHLALNWNLGEENNVWEELNDPSQTRVKAYAQYLRDLDPYDHHTVIHTYPEQQVEVYVPLLGDRSALTGVSLQTMHDRVYEDTRLWVRASEAAGKKWVVANDEQGGAHVGLTPDGEGNNHEALRREVLWGNLMAGGAGVEFYFGYGYPNNDLNAEDFRGRDGFWDYARHALTFFQTYLPFQEMMVQDNLASGNAHVLALPGEVYAVYLPEGKETRLDLNTIGAYSVMWFNPRVGGPLQEGSIGEIEAGKDKVDLGKPPVADGQDWAALLRRKRSERLPESGQNSSSQ